MWPFRDRDLTPDWRDGLPDPPPLPPGVSEKAIAATPPEPPPEAPSILVENREGTSPPPMQVRLRSRGFM
jgi:hypothetical protein